MLYKDNVDPRSKFKLIDKISIELKELIIICRKNFHHAQKLQKRVYNKDVKFKSYTPGNKVGLNGKNIKTKQNQNLEAKFFGLLQILHLVGKQAYKLKLLKKGKIYNVFYMLLLKQDITRKKGVDKNAIELDVGKDSGEYEVEAIGDSAVYIRELVSHLLGLYYLISGKSYLEDENTGKYASAVWHLRKLISTFYKDYFDKPEATLEAIDTVPLMFKPKKTKLHLIFITFLAFFGDTGNQSP